MNPIAISALAAIGGSAVGALAPVLSNVLVQRSAARLDAANRAIARREVLYADFIKEASRLYVTAVTHALEDLGELVSLYALLSRIRLCSSDPVLRAAEDTVKRITKHFSEPNFTLEKIADDIVSAKADPLAEFSFACRKELQDISNAGFSGSITGR